MKPIYKILNAFVWLLPLCFFSCSKETVTKEDPFTQALSGISSSNQYPNTFIRINSNSVFPVMNPDDGAYTQVQAKYTDSITGATLSMGNIKVGGNVITPGISQIYNQRLEPGSSIDISGANVVIETGPTAIFPFQSRIIYTPKAIYVTSFNNQGGHISTSSGHTLTWNADPDNIFHQVQIQVNYDQGLSQSLSPAFPNSVTDLVYRVNDNGVFNIPAADLQRFPIGCVIEIYVLRASFYSDGNIVKLDGSKKSITYQAIAEAASIPLSVVK